MEATNNISAYDQAVADVAAAVPQSTIDLNHIIKFVGWGFVDGVFDRDNADLIVGAYARFMNESVSTDKS